MMTLLLVLHYMVCFVLITVVLLQRGKGADLGATFGGGGANTLFGGRGAGNFLTKLTTGSAIVFMSTSLALAYLGSQRADIQIFDSSEAAQELPTERIPAGELAPAAKNEATGSPLEEIDPSQSGGDAAAGDTHDPDGAKTNSGTGGAK